jgi:hypothetical protein
VPPFSGHALQAESSDAALNVPAAHTVQDPEVPVEPVAQVTGALELPPSDWQSEAAVAPMAVIFPEGQKEHVSADSLVALNLPASQAAMLSETASPV